ncbi:hypothetical protein [Actinoallomurus iriomotensis]|uniref:PknH-like extracellular domain-containing protein n=1 Tax=Actinoallomurus iriomotensis TaxID=478107 RepID=A0A9W6SEN1_9ACTN|nr:hypothetical protein [Actinoallomurus iriomotensis]GLY90837.1 hypothetical protein Airi02_087660 [Actinoallomurus iriomotensis]
MTSRRLIVVAAFLSLASAAGCGGGGGGRAGGGSTPSYAAPVPGSYNADQLTQALLTDIPGYVRSGAPQWGEYGSLAAIQNLNQMQQAVKLDKPQCASSTRAVSQEKAVQTAPSALVAFAQGNKQSVTETLMAVGPDVAARQVKVSVPADCRSFRVKVGSAWVTDTIYEPTGTRIGEGSRTAGILTSSGVTSVRTWFVVLRSRGYLATITLYGPGATRVQAEGFARQAYQQAERILP